MKNILLIAALFAVGVSFAQTPKKVITKKAAQPFVSLLPTEDTLTIEKKEIGKTVYKAIPIRLLVRSHEKVALTDSVKLLNGRDHGMVVQTFNSGAFSITPEQYQAYTLVDSTPGWIAEGIVNLKIEAGSNAADNTIYLFRTNDVTTSAKLLIRANKESTSATVSTPATASTPATGTTPTNAAAQTLQNTPLQPATNSSDDDDSKPGLAMEKNKISIRETAESKIRAFYSKNRQGDDEAQDTIHIQLLTSVCDTFSGGHVDTVTFEYKNLNFPNGSFTILDPQKILTKESWKILDAEKKTCVADVVLHVTKTNVDTIKQDLLARIVLKEGEGQHIIRLSNTGRYVTNPFWLELGTNFNLLDKIEMNNVYGGVFMFEKDIAKVSKRTALSFTGGIYESKSSSSLNSSDSGLVYRDNTSTLADTIDRYTYFKDTGTFTTTSSVSSIGLFFSPHYRITHRPTEDNGFHMFVSFYAEMLWQRVKVTYDYSHLGRAQTLYLATDKHDSIYAIRFKEKEKEFDFRSHYFGFGLPIYIKDDNFNFYLNTVFGLSTQNFILINSLDTTVEKNKFPFAQSKKTLVANQNSFAQPKHNFSPFYLFQFRLNEENFGASITGEIRGFLLKNTKAVISISVSKKFNLPALLNNIVAPFKLGD